MFWRSDWRWPLAAGRNVGLRHAGKWNPEHSVVVIYIAWGDSTVRVNGHSSDSERAQTVFHIAQVSLE